MSYLQVLQKSMVSIGWDLSQLAQHTPSSVCLLDNKYSVNKSLGISGNGGIVPLQIGHLVFNVYKVLCYKSNW